MTRKHWFGEDVVTIDTTLGRLPKWIPAFERQPFGRNRFHDVIIRRSRADEESIPVGLVSKNYVLVQHADAIQAVTAEITNAGIDPAVVRARLLISEYGTRMALRATLPAAHAFTPADGHPMALTFECFNSVDGTVPLFGAVGWFRFVCSNGLLVGTTSATVRQKHSPPLRIDDIMAVLADGMASALQDRESFDVWRTTRISGSHLAAWVDGPVAEAWGPLAAARVHGISTTGFDGKPAGPAKKRPPHTWPLVQHRLVPGTEAPCHDGYAVAQVLAWVAAQRNDVAQRLNWRAQIKPLMSHLIPLQGSEA
ncbi:MAG: DUF932 domain-containing protein [Vicinamibacterales bacterium]